MFYAKVSFIVAVMLVSGVSAYLIYSPRHDDWPMINALDSDANLKVRNERSTKPLIVHFWASWCAPCQEEFPLLRRSLPAIAEHADVRLVSLDEGRDEALKFLTSVAFPVGEIARGWDPKKVLATRLGTVKLPETYIFTSRGTLRRKISGPMDWTHPKNLDYIRDATP